MHFLVTVAVLVSAPPSGGAAARRAEATAALEAAERARGATVIENAQQSYERGWAAESRLGFFGEAARLVDDGKRKLARVELEAAADAFARAERLYETHRWPDVDAAWAEAATWHGVALFELKRRDEARAAFGRAKVLEPATELTEAMVRPEVARAFAAARAAAPALPADASEARWPAEPFAVALALDDVVRAAVAIDAGLLTWAATRTRPGCATDVVTATSPEELVRRLDEATCRPGRASDPAAAPAIAHPRPAPSLTKREPPVPRRTRVWEKPLLWVGVVGALGVGVVLAVNLWPRDASYSLSADFHQFALKAR